MLVDSKKQGTSHVHSHLAICKRRVKGSTQAELVFGVGSDALGTWKFNQENGRKALALMVVEDELPFIFVEAKVFNHFTFVIYLRFKVPCGKGLL